MSENLKVVYSSRFPPVASYGGCDATSSATVTDEKKKTS